MQGNQDYGYLQVTYYDFPLYDSPTQKLYKTWNMKFSYDITYLDLGSAITASFSDDI